jgi:16S rRNA (cytidine1402-2'-O)-methyltransferase
MSGTLFIVATPIGNLDDLTPRARQTLTDVDLIAAEDTRHTGRLLSHIGVKTPQKALHDHNESKVVPAIIETLIDGKNVALVSDAGTPLVSDPGFRLVAAAHENNINVSPIPGSSSVTAALSAAGLPTDRFCFEGFLPPKRMARQALLHELAVESRTLVFFESVHRVKESVSDMAGAFGADRMAFVGRELSKMHEQCVQGSFADIEQKLSSAAIPEKGEFVIVVSGSREKQASAIEVDLLIEELAAVLPGKQAAAIAAKVTGEKRNTIYARMLELTKNQP